MAEECDALILDLIEWVGREPRSYSEVMEAWRTSCPRLPVWEEAVDRRYVARDWQPGLGARVSVTQEGEHFLNAHGRQLAG